MIPVITNCINCCELRWFTMFSEQLNVVLFGLNKKRDGKPPHGDVKLLQYADYDLKVNTKLHQVRNLYELSEG